MRRGSSCNNNRDCCPDPCSPGGGCKVFSSSITYDGPEIPELCVKPGTPLNDVIATMGKVMKAVQKTAQTIVHEEFDGLEEGSGSYYVQLESTPSDIIQVTFCGTVLPTDAYQSRNNMLYFNKNYCLSNPDAEVSVFYASKYTAGFNTRC